MAGGDGIELLKAIRSIHPNIPVVFLVTGFSDYSTEQALELGAQRVFEKPYSRKELFRALDEAIGYERAHG